MSEQKEKFSSAWNFEGAQDTLSGLVDYLKLGDIDSVNGLINSLPADLAVPNMILGAPMSGVDFSESKIRGVAFDYSDLSGANFHKSFLPETSFINVDLSAVNMSKAFLEKVMFGQSDLTNSNFSNALLFEANFMRANLEGANFSNADLENANFMHSINADKANFEGVDLLKVRHLKL